MVFEQYKKYYSNVNSSKLHLHIEDNYEYFVNVLNTTKDNSLHVAKKDFLDL